MASSPPTWRRRSALCCWGSTVTRPRNQSTARSPTLESPPTRVPVSLSTAWNPSSPSNQKIQPAHTSSLSINTSLLIMSSSVLTSCFPHLPPLPPPPPLRQAVVLRLISIVALVQLLGSTAPQKTYALGSQAALAACVSPRTQTHLFETACMHKCSRINGGKQLYALKEAFFLI